MIISACPVIMPHLDLNLPKRSVEGIGTMETTKGETEQNWQFSSDPSGKNGVIWKYEPLSTNYSCLKMPLAGLGDMQSS